MKKSKEKRKRLYQMRQTSFVLIVQHTATHNTQDCGADEAILRRGSKERIWKSICGASWRCGGLGEIEIN